MRKILLTLMILAFCSVASGAGTQKQIQFVDEWGEAVNMGTDVSFYIYNVGTTTEQTCYTNNTGATTYVVTQPVEDDSANTVIDYTTGLVTFWSGTAGYKLTVTDGTYTRTIDNLHGGVTRFGWPSYLVAMSARTVSDAQTWVIGTETDVTFDWDNANTKFVMLAAADTSFEIGADDYQFDVKFFADTDGDYMNWDNDGEALDFVGTDIHLDDDSDIYVGTDKDWRIESDTTKILEFIPLAGDETYAIYIGAASAGADLKIFGTDAGDYLEWDASLDLFTIVGDAVAWTLTEAAGTAVNIDITGAGGGFDLDTTDGPIALTTAGAANGDMTLTVADKFILLSTDAQADGIDIEAHGGAAGTIHVHNDDGTAVDSIELISDEGGVTVTTTLGATAISGIGAHSITSTAVADAAYGLEVASTIAGTTKSEGAAIYAHTSLTGAWDAATYNLGSWLDITDGTPTGTLAAAIDCGIYAPTTPTLAATMLVGLQVQTMIHAGAAPASHYMMRFNTSAGGDVPDAWFQAANPQAITYAENTLHGTSAGDKVGAIKIRIVGATSADQYIYTYSHAGQ